MESTKLYNRSELNEMELNEIKNYFNLVQTIVGVEQAVPSTIKRT